MRPPTEHLYFSRQKKKALSWIGKISNKFWQPNPKGFLIASRCHKMKGEKVIFFFLDDKPTAWTDEAPHFTATYYLSAKMPQAGVKAIFLSRRCLKLRTKQRKRWVFQNIMENPLFCVCTFWSGGVWIFSKTKCVPWINKGWGNTIRWYLHLIRAHLGQVRICSQWLKTKMAASVLSVSGIDASDFFV